LSLLQQYVGVVTLGSGKNPLPWVSLEDVLGVFYHVLMHSESHGVYNVCAPVQSSVRMFHQLWAKAIGMPFWGAVPWQLCIPIFGRDMLSETMCQGVPAVPEKLESEGFSFLHPTLDAFFNHAVDIQTPQEWCASKL
jgi:uncharacterized protein